jgi:polar amino acid transport system substrate-binding protein
MDRGTFIRGGVAIAVGGAMAAAGSRQAQSQTAAGGAGSRFDVIKERGKLLVGTMTTIPPFAFKDDTGTLKGFDVDIARVAARAMFNDETKVDFVSVSGDGRFPAVLTGQSDFGFATIYMARASIVAFTTPYVDTSITLLVSRRSGLQTLEDVNKAGVTVAILNNPQMADRAKQFFPNAKTATFDGMSSQLLALRSNRAQAMQVDTPVANYFATTNKDDVEVLNARLGDIFGNGIYSQPNDFKWHHWLDTFVQELRTGSLYSEYNKIYNTWFGRSPPPQRFYS